MIQISMCLSLSFCLLSQRTFSKQRFYVEADERFSGVIFSFNKSGIREYLIPQMKRMNNPDQNRTLVPCSLFSGCQVQSSA